MLSACYEIRVLVNILQLDHVRCNKRKEKKCLHFYLITRRVSVYSMLLPFLKLVFGAAYDTSACGEIKNSYSSSEEMGLFCKDYTLI